jgi:hypothetical protein
MGLNMAYQFAFAAMLNPNAKQITRIEEGYQPPTNNSSQFGTTSYGPHPIMDEFGNVTNVTHTLYSGDNVVGYLTKTQLIGGIEHTGILLQGLPTTIDLPSFMTNPFDALSQGYLTFGVCHTTTNIALLNAGYTTTVNSIAGSWSTALSTFTYGPYGGSLYGAIAFNQLQQNKY